MAMASEIVRDHGNVPSARHRATGLLFAHEYVDMRGVLPPRIVALRPFDAMPDGAWVALTADGEIVRIDLTARAVVTLAQTPGRLSEETMLHVSPDGRLAAVVGAYGQCGSVIDLETGTETMRLERDDYYCDVSVLPAAFVMSDGRPLLVHGTAWNRLDVSDPLTGRLLTARTPPSYGVGARRLPHYLDYFHGGLTVSPGGGWIADNGWVWHPVGVIATWDLRRWIEGNAWESEDGPSRRDLCDHDEWDKPLCWIDDHRLAVWGYREPEPPAVRVFDVATGREMRSFVGPLGELVYDSFLFSFTSELGTSVWDVETGTLLLRDDMFAPTAYHRGARQFVTLLPDGVVRRSRLWGHGPIDLAQQGVDRGATR